MKNNSINNELQATYNYMESEFLTLKELARIGEKALKDYLKGVKLPYRFYDCLKNNYKFIDFLKDMKKYKIDIDSIIEVFFANKYGKELMKKEVVIEALRATDDVKYIEVADKLQLFSSSISSNVHANKDYARANLLLHLIFENEISIDHYFFDESKISVEPNAKINGLDGKKRSVRSEFEYMKRKAKRISRKDINLSKKFKNIAVLNQNIKIDTVYSSIIDYINEHTRFYPSKIDVNDLREIRKFVVSHKDDFIYDCLMKIDLLDFVGKQHEGRIR